MPSSISFICDYINSSVMIQKLDKKALALRLFGKDTDDQDDQEKVEVASENRMESEEV
jgi:hypothetical protein